MARNSPASTAKLKALLSNPSVLAFGFNPETGTAEVMVRNGENEMRKSLPLKPEYAMLFNVIRGLLP